MNTVQSIHESRTGVRYIVVAVLNVLFTAFLIYGQYAGLAADDSILTTIAYIIHAIFTIVVAYLGKAAADDVKEREFEEKVSKYITRR